MDKKQRLFIYGRREVGILFLLGVTVAVFAFTLGVHLGKKVGLDIPSSGLPTSVASSVPMLEDKTPSNQDFVEQGKGTNQAAEESLNQALHDEVGRRGIRLDAPKQVDLPRQAKTHDGGATDTEPKEDAQSVHAETHEPASGHEDASKKEGGVKGKSLHESSAEVDGKFAIQVGSYPSVTEAQSQADALEKAGLQPFLKPADVKGMGKRYRVFVGAYATRDEAQKAGEKYRSQKRFGSFIVGKVTKD